MKEDTSIKLKCPECGAALKHKVNTMYCESCNIEIIQLEDKRYEQYYWLRKDLYNKSKEMNFGYGQLPSKFTEGLCNQIYKMTSTNGSERYLADSIDKDEQYVEIKCTQQDNTSVSINKELKFNYLLWININYDEDEFYVKKYTVEEIQNLIDGLNNEEKNKKRLTIDLNKIQKNDMEVFCFIKDE